MKYEVFTLATSMQLWIVLSILLIKYCTFLLLHIKIIEEIVKGIGEKIPRLINEQEVMKKYPVMYEESMNTVLVQEVIR